MINNEKKFLRKVYKNNRSNTPIGQFQELCKDILDNLIELSIWDKEIYHVYLSVESKHEVDTNDIITVSYTHLTLPTNREV